MMYVLSTVLLIVICALAIMLLMAKRHSWKKDIDALENTLKENEAWLKKLKEEHMISVSMNEELLFKYNQLEKNYNWYRFFYAEYAAWERLRQYGICDETMALIAQYKDEFIDVTTVSDLLVAPPSTGGKLNNSFIYFGARMLFLNNNAKMNVYSISYHGGGSDYIGEGNFDILYELPSTKEKQNFIIQQDKSYGILNTFLENYGYQPFLNGEANYFSPFSMNTADLTGNGVDDFVFGGQLFLNTSHKEGYHPYTEFDENIGNESGFVTLNGRNILITLEDNAIALRVWENEQLVLMGKHEIQDELAKNRAFTVMPLHNALIPQPEAGFFIITEHSFDLYKISIAYEITRVASFLNLQPGEVFLGGAGNFSGGNTNDIWLSESRWKNEAGEIVGRISLLSSEDYGAINKFNSDDRKRDIAEFARTTIIGSSRYTDYDGIGSTLSPVAGHLLGGRIPDLSFSGHRHMNEAGVMFILPGYQVKPGIINVEESFVIKIIGQPVSQLAPPFYHFDAIDLNGDGYHELIVSADNDLYAGPSIGAIYVLNGKKIKEAWGSMTQQRHVVQAEHDLSLEH